jgi:hypothetical protein
MFFKLFKHETRLRDLEATCAALLKEKKERELEWDSVYEKFRLLYMRLSKRVKQVEGSPSTTEGTLPEESVETLGGNQAISTLTPRQQQVQRMIMMRRNRAS